MRLKYIMVSNDSEYLDKSHLRKIDEVFKPSVKTTLLNGFKVTRDISIEDIYNNRYVWYRVKPLGFKFDEDCNKNKLLVKITIASDKMLNKDLLNG
jgi:hypothetical protein